VQWCFCALERDGQARVRDAGVVVRRQGLERVDGGGDVALARLVRAVAEPGGDEDVVPDLRAAEQAQAHGHEQRLRARALGRARLERDLRRRAAHVEEAERRAVRAREAVHEVVDGEPAEQALLLAGDDPHGSAARPVARRGGEPEARAVLEGAARRAQPCCSGASRRMPAVAYRKIGVEASSDGGMWARAWASSGAR
jgi:hypothetical protein